MDSLEALDAAVARHLACSVVAHLLRLGLFDSLAKGAPTGELAAACEVEPAAFEAAIGFAVRFSGLLKTEGEDRVRFSDFLMGSDTARFRLLKYLGAYQPCVMSLGEAAPADGLLAMAYRQLSRRSPVGLVSYLMELKPRTVLEIGCGSAPVLRALASQDPRVSGLAVDPDASMVALARELVQTQRLSERVAIAEGSLSDVAEHCPQGWPPFDVLVLRSVLNEAFAQEGEPARVLTRLAATHHGARIVVCEYLSQLGTPFGRERGAVQTLSHDLVQVLSGQGLPPAILEGWDEIYAAAGLRRYSRRVDQSLNGVTQFIDLIAAEDAEVVP
jgi:SAM-dependent methyltransferase